MSTTHEWYTDEAPNILFEVDTDTVGICECCWEEEGWNFLVDQNMETVLCGGCAEALKSECDVEEL